VILEAEMSPELKTYILGLAGVTSFLGMSKEHKEPIALPQDEVDRLLGIADPDRDFKTFSYMPGDMVRVISGPFSDFEGIVQKTADEGNKLVIDVTVFGRRTPVELSGNQVEIIKK
jgi:transcription termination/antitermination protein NusG